MSEKKKNSGAFAWLKKLIGFKSGKDVLCMPPVCFDPTSALSPVDQAAIQNLIKDVKAGQVKAVTIKAPCKAACESPPETARAAVLFMPVGKKRFGFLAPRRCECIGCKAMRKIAKNN